MSGNDFAKNKNFKNFRKNLKLTVRELNQTIDRHSRSFMSRKGSDSTVCQTLLDHGDLKSDWTDRLAVVRLKQYNQFQIQKL